MNNSEIQERWQKILRHIKPKMSEHVYNTWFAAILPQPDSDNITLNLAVRDQFSRDWLQEHYGTFLHQEVQSLEDRPVAIDWSINPSLFTQQPIKTDVLQTNEVTESPETVSAQTKPIFKAKPLHLNQNYHFSNFICGPSNEFAHAAARAVAAKPGRSYNPLFLFGDVGLGKTHLLSAIGHTIQASHPDAKIVYQSSESFANEVVDAVLNGKLEDFRRKYREDTDVLLMDDIQLLAGKERTQHELFHIFNVMYDSNRQIVLTSDKLPHDLPDVEDRLRSRFQWGLITDIQPPEIETRVAIVKSKAQREGLEITEDLSFHLARHVASNVRELEGALVRILAHASLTKRPLSIEYIDEILNNIVPRSRPELSIESIQEAVARYFRLKVADLRGAQRRQSIVRPRHVAMYLCRKHVSKASFPAIGDQFGKKDHATVMNAVKKVDRALDSDRSLQSQIQDLEQQLDVSPKG